MEIELPLAPLLHRMERAGLRVDTSVLSELSKYLGQELEKLTERIHKAAGREFKINSPKQVGEVLEELNISSGRKTSTVESRPASRARRTGPGRMSCRASSSNIANWTS